MFLAMRSDLFQKGISINGRWIPADSLPLPAGAPGRKNELIRGVSEFLFEWFHGDDMIGLQTSGSTGRPKLMKVSRPAMEASARMTGSFFGLKEGMRAHLCLSPEFVAGKMMIVRAIVLGLDLVVTTAEANPLESLDAEVDFSAMVPFQLARVLKQDAQALNKVRQLIIGGGAILPPLEQALQNISTHCWHTYGMTETLTHVAVRALNGEAPSKWFKPLPGVSLSTDNRGCLVVKAPGIAEGTVVTNDLVVLQNNRFQVTGRWDQVIISAGRKLHPEEIEKKLGTIISFPFFLFPEQHSEAGQIPVLYVEANLDEQQQARMQQQLEEILEPHERPRKIKALPRFHYLVSGKIDRLATSEDPSGTTINK